MAIQTITNTEEQAPISHPTPPDCPQYTAATPETYNPEADLMVSRGIRGLVTKALVAERIPTDPKEVETLLKVLKDQDSQALGIIRAKIEKDAGAVSGAQAAMVRELLNGLRNTDASQLGYAHAHQAIEGDGSPTLPYDLETREFVPGEMDVGATHTTFEEFKKRVGADIKFAESDKEDE